ncbi:jg12428 [Pararge aegeria aegeria]|uniref:Jg12428 protein n=1 Tax=Pararge aegeria aegeria TaxID=348720 RepID=A0A8S4R8D4_9NEOP|nr:jg12428 [Pararge aegeria aegeria]
MGRALSSEKGWTLGSQSAGMAASLVDPQRGGQTTLSASQGAFTSKVSKITICKGPKRTDCSNNTIKLENEKTLLLNMDIQRNVIPNRGKIIISINGQLLLRLQMKKPCDHVFLKPIAQKYLNVTEECEFKKGKFTLQLSEISMCKGPKRSECSNNNARIENRSHMLINMDVQKNVIPTRGKVLVLLNGQTLVRLQMKKPCDHVFLKPVFQKLLNVTQYCEFAKGEFILKITNLEVCKGPKQTDCNDMSARLENGTTLLLNVHVKEDVIPNRGKVEAMLNNKPLLRLQMKNPCDHLFMKPLIPKNIQCY